MADVDAVEPFVLDVPGEALADLQERLRRTRWPDRETVADVSQGPPTARLRRLVDRWEHGYDWRRVERQLNAWGQFRTDLDGLGVHFLHVRSAVPDARPLLLTHGWPGSVLEFRHAIGPLTDPVAHGGSARDAFHLVIPTLPGFGFSDRPDAVGWDLRRTARAWAGLMRRLGYRRWFAQGGDLGAVVTCELAGLQAASDIGLAGIHLNMTPFLPTEAERRDATAEERQMLAESDHYAGVLSAYAHQMSTRPQTIGYALADSPVALAAWIYAMFQDVGGGHHEHGDAEKLFDLDEILDDVMLYWLPNTATSAARVYWEEARRERPAPGTGAEPVTVPTGISIMPGEFVRRSRRWVEARFSDLVLLHEVAAGGHFALLEQPQLLVEDIRATVRAIDAR